jgi:hypothetical protein
MPTPTQFYRWTLPVEGQDPWFETINTAFITIDASVSSAAQVAIPKRTMVISSYPTADLEVTSANVVNQGATDGYWAIFSSAPFGRCVGSFHLVGSGAQALFDLRIQGAAMVNASGQGNNTIGFRLVLQSSSLIVPGNSQWSFRFNYSGLQQNLQAFIGTRSLGPGNFSVEIQGGHLLFASGSYFVVPANAAGVVLIVSEYSL